MARPMRQVGFRLEPRYVEAIDTIRQRLQRAAPPGKRITRSEALRWFLGQMAKSPALLAAAERSKS